MTELNPRTARVLVPLTGLLLAAFWALVLRGQARGFVAWDFPLYYSAGRLPGLLLFDKAAQQADQQAVHESALLSLRPYHYSIYLKPAAYKLVLDPIARLPFWTAFNLWVAMQLAGLAGALYFFSRSRGFPPEWWLLLPVNPYLFYMVYWGQDTGLVLLALALAWVLSERGQWFLAGACLALCLVKWNLFLLMVPLFVAHRKWRGLAGFVTVASVGAAISVAIAGWDGTMAYAQLLHAPEADYLAAGMPSVRGQLPLLGVPGYMVAGMLVALNLALWILQSRLSWRPAFAAGVAGCVALSYHTMIYDLLFLLVPALLLRDEWPLRTIAFTVLFIVWVAPIPPIGPAAGMVSVALAATLVWAAGRTRPAASESTCAR